MEKPFNPQFIGADGKIYPSELMCSGLIPGELTGDCPYSNQGKFPGLIKLSSQDPNYSVDKGNPDDWCPVCAKHQLGSLDHWQGHHGQIFPDELLPLRLFKCRLWFWLVIPGLCNSNPSELSSVPNAVENKKNLVD
jgi:hypothetical protein